MKSLPLKLASLVTLGMCVSIPGHAQIFTGADGTDGNGYYNYSDPLNWSTGAVPDLTTATTAYIGTTATYTTPVSATYEAGHGDLVIKNGGTLEIGTGGSYTQAGTPAYLQLNGGGNILIDGGMFSQGSATSNPFNIIGTNNTFTISSGSAVLDTSVSLVSGLTWLQTGGTVTTGAGNEFDVNSNTASMTGGILNTKLLTNINGPGGTSFQFSGGVINFSDAAGIYGGATDQLNFTSGSTGVINFANTSAAGVESLISGGQIEYNNALGTYSTTTGTDANFTVISTGANSAELVSGIIAAPEPSTYAMLGAGLLTLVVALRRRAAKL